MTGHGYVSVISYLQKQAVVQIWPTGYSLLIPALENGGTAILKVVYFPFFFYPNESFDGIYPVPALPLHIFFFSL